MTAVEIVDALGTPLHPGDRLHITLNHGTVTGEVHDLIEGDGDPECGHHPILLVSVEGEIEEFSCPPTWWDRPSQCREVQVVGGASLAVEGQKDAPARG